LSVLKFIADQSPAMGDMGDVSSRMFALSAKPGLEFIFIPPIKLTKADANQYFTLDSAE